MNEHEQSLFQEIVAGYGERETTYSLDEVMVYAESVARRLMAVVDYETCDDEREAGMIAGELGERLDSEMIRCYPALDGVGMVITSRPQEDGAAPAVVEIVQEDSVSGYRSDTVPIEEGDALAGRYVGMNVEVYRDDDGGYRWNPVVVLDDLEVKTSRDHDGLIIDRETAYAMAPLDVTLYCYEPMTPTAERDEIETVSIQDQSSAISIDLRSLLSGCLEVEQERSWGTHSSDQEDECYSKLMLLLEEHSLAPDTKVQLIATATRLLGDYHDDELIAAAVIIEQPNLYHNGDQWIVQLQFSVQDPQTGEFILYGAKPQNILTIDIGRL